MYELYFIYFDGQEFFEGSYPTYEIALKHAKTMKTLYSKGLYKIKEHEDVKNKCDCGSELVFEEQLSVLDEYDDKLLVCNKYYCPKCFDQYEINEEILKGGVNNG